MFSNSEVRTHFVHSEAHQLTVSWSDRCPLGHQGNITKTSYKLLTCSRLCPIINFTMVLRSTDTYSDTWWSTAGTTGGTSVVLQPYKADSSRRRRRRRRKRKSVDGNRTVTLLRLLTDSNWTIRCPSHEETNILHCHHLLPSQLHSDWPPPSPPPSMLLQLSF